MEQEQQNSPNVKPGIKKPTTIYWFLIFAPFAALMLSAILQVISSFVFSTVEGSVGRNDIVDIITLVIGIISVISIFLLPLWIILLIISIDHNKKIR